MLVLSVTGHRPDKLGGYSDAAHARLVKVALIGLRKIKPDSVVTGMAQGWDQAVARACIKLKIPFTAAVPFEGQESKWPEDSQKYYRKLLRYAAKTEVVFEGGYAAWKLLGRNKWMIDNSDAIMALWNGDPTGGTHDALVKATKAKMRVYQMWTDYVVESMAESFNED